MTARWEPCDCGHRREGHDPVKDGGRCNHPGCACRRFARPKREFVVTAPPSTGRAIQPVADRNYRT